jgi:glycosyltransferase 2 family protein
LRLVRIGVGLLIAALFILLLFRHVPPGDALDTLWQVSLAPIAMGAILVLAAYLVRALRWQLLLSGTGIEAPFATVAPIFFSSFALNNVLPLRTGDVYRWAETAKLAGGTLPKAFAALAVERMLDLAILAALFLLLAITAPPVGVKHLKALIVVLGGMALFALIVMLAAPRTTRRIVRSLRFASRPVRVVRWLAERALATTDAVERILEARTLALMLLTLGAWALELLVFVTVAHAFGATSYLTGGLSAGLLGTLATLIPGAPGHVGTFDYFAAQGFRVGGIAPTAAVSAAVASHLLIVLPVTVIGSIQLILRHRTTFGMS